MIYEYDIQRADSVTDQYNLLEGMGKDGWRLVSAVYNSIGAFYLLYFERLKQ